MAAITDVRSLRLSDLSVSDEARAIALRAAAMAKVFTDCRDATTLSPAELDERIRVVSRAILLHTGDLVLTPLERAQLRRDLRKFGISPG